MTFAELVLLLVLLAGVFAIAGWVAEAIGWLRGRKPETALTPKGAVQGQGSAE